MKYLDLFAKRNELGNIRSLSLFKGYTDFYSNDYLGLSKLNFVEIPLNFGSTGSRLLSGNSDEAEEAEAFISEFFGSEKALIYNSGYDANIGFFSSIPQKGEFIIYDEYVHASIRDGIRLSNATNYSFKHNCLIELEKKINNIKGTIFVVVESIYSMHGDRAPIDEIFKLSEKYNLKIIIDEAHAVGVLGQNGKGLSFEFSKNPSLFARIITFSKAYGTIGGAVLGEKELIDYLINFSRSFIYSTALPPFIYNRIKKSVEYTSNNPQLNLNLLDNIHYFNKIRTNKTTDISPIQTIVLGEIERTIKAAEKIQSKNIAVKPILPPTVKKGEERIRICLHSFNTRKEIEQLYHILTSI